MAGSLVSVFIWSGIFLSLVGIDSVINVCSNVFSVSNIVDEICAVLPDVLGAILVIPFGIWLIVNKRKPVDDN